MSQRKIWNQRKDWLGTIGQEDASLQALKEKLSSITQWQTYQKKVLYPVSCICTRPIYLNSQTVKPHQLEIMIAMNIMHCSKMCHAFFFALNSNIVRDRQVRREAKKSAKYSHYTDQTLHAFFTKRIGRSVRDSSSPHTHISLQACRL